MVDTVVVVQKVVHTVQVAGAAAVTVVKEQTVQVVTVGFQGPAGGGGGVDTTPVPVNFAFGDASPRVILPGLAGKIVLAVNINIATPFNGAGASLSVGTLASPELLVAPTQLDLSVATEFEIDPNVSFPTATDIYLTLSPGAGATQGAGWLVFAFAVLS